MEDKKATTKKFTGEDNKLWQEIARLPIDLFALPDQQVSNYVKVVDGMTTADSKTIFVTFKTPAVLPALEEVFVKAKLKLKIEPVASYFEISEEG